MMLASVTTRRSLASDQVPLRGPGVLHFSASPRLGSSPFRRLSPVANALVRMGLFQGGSSRGLKARLVK